MLKQTLLASVLLLSLVHPSEASSVTALTLGLDTGSEPRTVCVYDTSQNCVPIGTLNDTTHVFTPNSAANSNVAASNTALTALPSSASPVTRLGVYVAGDAPPLVFYASSSTCTLNSGAGDVGTQVPTSDSKCWLSNASQINVLEFGAYPNYTNQSTTTTAFQNWWKACMLSKSGSYGGAGGNDCFMPAGHYSLTSLVWDFATNAGGGGYIHGAGSNATELDFSATTGNYLYIHNSSTAAWYYAHFANFGVYAANTTNGDKAALQVNPVPTSSTLALDAANGVAFDNIVVGNATSCAAGSAAISSNSLYASTFRNTSTYNFGCATNGNAAGTNPSGGDSWRISGSEYNNFIGGSISTATNGIHLTATTYAYTNGNKFTGIVEQSVYNDYLIDNANVTDNIIDGGQGIWCNTVTASGTCTSGSTGYLAYITAGSGNTFLNVYFGAQPTASLVGGTACTYQNTFIWNGGVYGNDACPPTWNINDGSASNQILQFKQYQNNSYITALGAGHFIIGITSGQSLDFTVNSSQIAGFGYYANGYQNTSPVAIANLGTCNSNAVGTLAWINNGVASPTYHATVSTTGSATWPVYCTYNGTTYAWVY